MDVFEAIAQRHSYRGPFKEQRVRASDLTRIVQAGLQAPSGCNMQTTTFVIVDDAELVRHIAALHGNNTAMQQARAYIACVMDTNPPPAFGNMSFQVEDCAAAVENMLLAVTALGYATVWVDGWLRAEGHAERIGALLKLPAGKYVRIILPLGVPAEKHSPREKKPFAERAWFNRHGG